MPVFATPVTVFHILPAGLAARLAPVAMFALLAAPGYAVAEDSERCSGTLCDLYYTVRPAPQPAAAPSSQQASATPVTVPSTGGILNFFKNSPPAATAATSGAAPAKPFMYLTDGTKYDHCTGTLCDAYYGSSLNKPAAPPPQQQASTGSANTPAGTSLTPPRPAPSAEQIALAKAMQQRRAAQDAQEQAKAKCRLAGGSDPWHCFR